MLVFDMKNKTLFFWTLLIFALSFTASFAAERPGELSAALRSSWLSNPSIRAAVLRYEAAVLEAGSEGALSPGELAVADSIIGEGATDSAMELSQPLEINGARGARKKAALSRAEERRMELLIQVEDVSLLVKELYWDLVRLESELSLKKANELYFRNLRAMILRQIDAGTLPGFHLLRADAALSSAVQDVRTVELELSEKRGAFVLAAGTPFEYPSGFSPETFVPDDFSSSFPPLFSPVKDHPSLLLPGIRAETAEREIKAERASLYPDLDLIMRKETFDDRGGAGLRLRVPVFGWGKASGKMRSLRKISESERVLYEGAAGDLDQSLQSALASVFTYESVIMEYDGHVLKNAAELVRVVEKAYSKGAAGFLDLMDAKKNQTDASAARIAMSVEYLKAYARLERCYGVTSKEYVGFVSERRKK